MHHKRVEKFELQNGLTVLVCPKKNAAKVSIQLWYNVGSKHEGNGERGIAHFIEHMIFKGTHEMLSESDINLITNKLSGYCNAFTSYDYTGYLFDIPVANWAQVLPVMADCMQHVAFKQDHLNSEVKAVIQELKMYNDSYSSALAEKMVSMIFPSHPYHHPIIGYKQDLWSVNRDVLQAFYGRYYVPNNAALVIAGDVNPQEVFALVKDAFEAVPRGNDPQHQEFFVQESIVSQSIQLYKDVQQSIGMLAYQIPGVLTKNEFIIDVFCNIIANGKGSRLHKKLVDDLQLVSGLHAFVYDLFDGAVLFIEYYPTKTGTDDEIVKIMQQELDDIATHGIFEDELQRAQNLAQIEYQHMLEDTQKQAYAIGKYYIGLADEEYAFLYGQDMSKEEIATEIQMLVARYCKKSLQQKGQVLPIAEEDKPLFQELQEISDEQDAAILQAKARTCEVEDGKYVHNIALNNKKHADYPQAKIIALPNGLEVLLMPHHDITTVECILEYKTNHTYDPADKLGLSYVVAKMMLEGTKKYPEEEFATVAESYGIEFTTSPGYVSATWLSKDNQVGLELLTEMLTQPDFKTEALEKTITNTAIELSHFWDTPNAYTVHIAREKIYNNHPWSHLVFGTKATLSSMTLNDVTQWFFEKVSPQQARMALVGDFDLEEMEDLLYKTIASWQGSVVDDLSYPALAQLQTTSYDLYANRDQTVLVFAGLSIDRLHEDYDKILLYDQIFTGGVLNSMSSKLFNLREQSGLFYTIGGSLLYAAGKQPGMTLIKTIVSNDRIEEAKKAILHEIDHAIDTVTPQELQEAKNALINSFDGLYDTNASKASTMLYLHKYGFAQDYYSTRIASLEAITLEEMQAAVKKHVASERMICVEVGRKGKEKIVHV